MGCRWQEEFAQVAADNPKKDFFEFKNQEGLNSVKGVLAGVRGLDFFYI